MADCQCIAFHGWGFSGSDWQAWEENLSEYGTFQKYDRGYFGSPIEATLSDKQEMTVLIAHSFGLHLIEDSFFAKADLLVITGGFLHFHPYAAQYKRRSRLILQEMINNLEVEPEAVLHQFYENCYAPQQAPDRDIDELNHQLLLDDLQKLHNAKLDIQLLKKTDKVCILHGSDDHIVPNKKGREIYSQLNDKAQYFEIKGAGHALPYNYPKQCLEFLIPEIKTLTKVNE